MTRILLFGCKDPLEALSPEETLERGVLRRNSGNLLFSDAAHRTLLTPGTEVVVSDFEDLFDRPGRINEEFDHVVLAFANAFRWKFHRRLKRFAELVEQLTVPVTVLGVGAQSTLDGSLEPLRRVDPTVRRFVRAVLERSPSVGVRGELTAHYLRHLGFSDVEVIGCPSMFLHGADLRIEDHVLGPDSRVVVCARRDEPWMGRLMQRADRDHHRLTYIAQGEADLELMVRAEHRPPPHRSWVPTSLDHPLFREDKVRFFVDATTWIDFLRDADFCFGSRIHGNVAALLAGTPAHVLAHDSRTLELSRYFEIPHTPAPQVGPDTTAAELLARSDHGPLQANHGARFARYLGFVESHGLAHSFDHPGVREDVVTRLRDAPLPPPVGGFTGPEPAELVVAGR